MQFLLDILELADITTRLMIQTAIFDGRFTSRRK